jgi:hypothetical protein
MSLSLGKTLGNSLRKLALDWKWIWEGHWAEFRGKTSSRSEDKRFWTIQFRIFSFRLPSTNRKTMLFYLLLYAGLKFGLLLRRKVTNWGCVRTDCWREYLDLWDRNVTGGLRKLHNKKFYKLYFSQNITGVIKHGGGVVLDRQGIYDVWEDDTCIQNFSPTNERKRSIERPR